MYTKAILRKPGRNYANGITTANIGKPDFEMALKQHEGYCNALVKCGLELTILDADLKYPDGCFVEDTAIVTKEVAIITRPGSTSRLGEEVEISKKFSGMKKTVTIDHPGHVDGGDILRMEDHFFIGRSKRTNREGAAQLKSILSEYGYTSSEITVETVPHLKSGITYLGKGNFISIDEFSEKIGPHYTITIEANENYSSNCLAVNDYLLISKGFPRSRQKILDLGYNIIEVEMSEFRKMDGALTCLSLLI